MIPVPTSRIGHGQETKPFHCGAGGKNQHTMLKPGTLGGDVGPEGPGRSLRLEVGPLANQRLHSRTERDHTMALSPIRPRRARHPTLIGAPIPTWQGRVRQESSLPPPAPGHCRRGLATLHRPEHNTRHLRKLPLLETRKRRNRNLSPIPPCRDRPLRHRDIRIPLAGCENHRLVRRAPAQTS